MSNYETVTNEIVRLARLSQRLAFFLALCIGLSTIIRPLVVELEPVFTYFGWANTALMLTVYGTIASRRVDRHASVIIMLACLIALLPLLAISGGINSQLRY